MADIKKEKVIAVVNCILEGELAAVVCHIHYLFLMFGSECMPPVAWVRAQATEALEHAHQAGKWSTILGCRARNQAEQPQSAVAPFSRQGRRTVKLRDIDENDCHGVFVVCLLLALVGAVLSLPTALWLFWR